MAYFPDPVAQPWFYASVLPKRALAWVIDTLLIALMVAVFIPLTGFLALFFLGGLYLVFNFLYRWIGLTRRSATIGMRMMGIEFRDGQGLPIDGGTAFAHTLFYSLSMGFVLPQVVSVLMMVFGPRVQGLSDAVLGLVLVNSHAMR